MNTTSPPSVSHLATKSLTRFTCHRGSTIIAVLLKTGGRGMMSPPTSAKSSISGASMKKSQRKTGLSSTAISRSPKIWRTSRGWRYAKMRSTDSTTQTPRPTLAHPILPMRNSAHFRSIIFIHTTPFRIGSMRTGAKSSSRS